MVQNYILFLKLANKDYLIWHTHMRANYDYIKATETLCEFALDHNDDIGKNTLSNAYKKTAQRWKETYNTEYGQNIDVRQLTISAYASNCALVSRTKLYVPPLQPATKITSTDLYKTTTVNDIHSGSGGGGCGGGGG